MGFLDLFKRKATASTPIQNMSGWGSRSLSGATVTESTAMGLSAHFACVRLIATTLASLPIHIYERLPDGGKRKRNDHHIARLLREEPNEEMTSFSFIEAMQAQISNRGLALAEIEYYNGQIVGLWPIPPGVCEPRRNDKTKKIEYYFPNTGAVLKSDKIIHIPGLSFDGLNSFSPIQLFRLTFGIGIATEQFGAMFFNNGTNLGGFLRHPKNLSAEAQERLKTNMAESHSGLRNSHKWMVLEEGMEIEKLGMPLKDIQFIEARKFTVTEMARIHGVPPHLIGDLEKATFSNIEEQGIEAVVYSFRPWVVRWEKALNAKLFSEKEKNKFYVKFDLDGLLRGNNKSRFESYSIALNNGIFNVDEVREKEDMSPLPNGAGQIYRFPLNSGILGEKRDE